MDNNTEDTPQRRRSDPSSALVTIQGWADVCKEGKSSSRASAAWLELRGHSRRAGANKESRGQAGKDRRKWDYHRYGYADKPCKPRSDYPATISPELEKYYKERQTVANRSKYERAL